MRGICSEVSYPRAQVHVMTRIRTPTLINHLLEVEFKALNLNTIHFLLIQSKGSRAESSFTTHHRAPFPASISRLRASQS